MSAITRDALEYRRQMMVDFWRDMHQHPEPDFEETRAAAKIAAILRGFCIKVHKGPGGAGAVAVLRKAKSRFSPQRASQTMLEIHLMRRRRGGLFGVGALR